MRNDIEDKHHEKEFSFSKKKFDANELRGIGFSDIPLQNIGDSSPDYVLAYYIDAYLSFLEPLDYKETFNIPIEAHSPEFQTRRDTVMKAILTIPGFSKDNLQKASIDQLGLLHITFKDGSHQTLNLIESWNEANYSSEEKRIRQETRDKEQKLQEHVAKEAFYNGKVVAEIGDFKLTNENKDSVISVVTAGLGGITVGQTGLKVIKSMTIEDATGKRRISFKKPYVGTKDALTNTMGRIIETTGYKFDPETKKFINPARETFGASERRIRSMTFEEYKKQPYYKTEIATETQFTALKEQSLKATEPIMRDVSSGRITPQAGISKLKILKLNPVEAFFFPTFMMEFNKNQTPANAIAGLTDLGLFTLGFRGGNIVASKLPLPAKVILPLVTGGAAFAWGQYGAQKFLDANRKKWEYFQKSNYSDDRSFAAHALGGLGINESIDGLNSIYRGVTGSNTDGLDFGIDRTEVNIAGKHLFTLPELTNFQHKVTLGTNPRDWISAAATRDVGQWNESVDRYKLSITEEIYALLRKYINNTGIFADTSEIQKAKGKDELFKSELKELLMGGQESNHFATEIDGIVSGIATELPNITASTIPSSTINEIISLNVNSMHINSLYIEEAEKNNAIKKAGVLSGIEIMPITADQKNYVQLLVDRMIRNEEIIKNDTEKNMYSSLLANTKTITLGEQQMTVGNYFALLLDSMVDVKNEAYFLGNLRKGNMKGYNWTQTERTIAKVLPTDTAKNFVEDYIFHPIAKLRGDI